MLSFFMLGSNKPAEEIAIEISDLPVAEKEAVVSANISRGDDSTLNTNAKSVNEELKTLCGTKGLDFIEHKNIDTTKHLNVSDLHLKRMGTVLLAKKHIDVMMGLNKINTQL